VVSEKLVRILADQTAGYSWTCIAAGLAAQVVALPMHYHGAPDDTVVLLPEADSGDLKADGRRSVCVGLYISEVSAMPGLGKRSPMGTGVRIEMPARAARVRCPAVT
jgi:hypothetical protein